MSELKLCPFCGKYPKTNVYYSKCGCDGLTMVATVVCECGTSKGIPFEGNNVTFGEYKDAFECAIDIWNRRAE